VLGPLLLVAWRHVQVHRRAVHRHRRWRDDHRLRQDHRRGREVADVDPAVDPRLVDAHRHADAGLRKRGRGQADEDEAEDGEKDQAIHRSSSGGLLIRGT
jgi:hypothetical protein